MQLKCSACGVHMCNWYWPINPNNQHPAGLINKVFIHIVKIYNMIFTKQVTGHDRCGTYCVSDLCLYSSFCFVSTMFVCSCNRNTLKLGFEYILTIKISTIFNGRYCPTKHKGNGGDIHRWKKKRKIIWKRWWDLGKPTAQFELWAWEISLLFL